MSDWTLNLTDSDQPIDIEGNVEVLPGGTLMVSRRVPRGWDYTTKLSYFAPGAWSQVNEK